MAKSPVTIQFPFGGLNRRYGYQSQPPYTTPDCLNVRPFDSIEDRQRGGMRPGLKKTFAQQIGSGNPIRMLANVTSTSDVIPSWTVEVTNASDFSLNAVFEKSGLNLIMSTDPVLWPYQPEGLTFTQTITGDASARNIIFKALDGFSSVSSISIKDSYVTTFPTMSAFLNLYKLDLSNNLLTGKVPDLSGLVNLEELNIDKNNMTGSDVAIETFAKLKKLTVATAGSNKSFVWSTLPVTLTHLYYIDTAADATVRDINTNLLVNLEYIELWNNNRSNMTNAVVSCKYTVKLRGYFGSANTQADLYINPQPTATSLDVSYCNIIGLGILGTGTTVPYTLCRDLISIDASHNKLEWFNPNFSMIYSMRNLTNLNLSYNVIPAAGLQQIIHECLQNAQARPTSGGVTVPTCTVNIGYGNAAPNAATLTDITSLRNLGWTVIHS